MKHLAIWLVIGSCLANPEPLIEKISCSKNSVTITPNSSFKKKYLTNNFFISYQKDIDLEAMDYSLITMPFIMNVISIVWASGKTYYVKEMDDELFASLERVKKVFMYMYPATSWNGELQAQKLVSHRSSRFIKGIALPFSGGIDSTSSSLAKIGTQQLLITAWGHSDLPLEESSLWNERKRKIFEYGAHFGFETCWFKSNYWSFLNLDALAKLSPEITRWRLGAVEGLGWVGMTAPILMAKGYRTLVLSSSHTWLYTYPSAASPFIDNNLLFCGIKTVHDQFEVTRLGKIRLICTSYKNLGIEPFFLRVCNKNKKDDTNCGQCRKCVSSAIGFYALNENPVPFGLTKSIESTVKNALELIKPNELNWYTVLHFQEIKKVLKNRIERELFVHPALIPLISLQLDHKIPYDIKGKKKLMWQEMRPLCPSLVPIPMNV